MSERTALIEAVLSASRRWNAYRDESSAAHLAKIVGLYEAYVAEQLAALNAELARHA